MATRDINDYGKFETFYQPIPEKKDEYRDKEPETPQDRSSPFILDDFKGINAYQKTT